MGVGFTGSPARPVSVYLCSGQWEYRPLGVRTVLLWDGKGRRECSAFNPLYAAPKYFSIKAPLCIPDNIYIYIYTTDLITQSKWLKSVVLMLNLITTHLFLTTTCISLLTTYCWRDSLAEEIDNMQHIPTMQPIQNDAGNPPMLTYSHL